MSEHRFFYDGDEGYAKGYIAGLGSAATIARQVGEEALRQTWLLSPSEMKVKVAEECGRRIQQAVNNAVPVLAELIEETL